MNKLKYILMLFICCSGVVNAQVTTDPATPYDSQSVTITFDASEGSLGLMDYSGDIYAHTGVITDQSSSTSDWKYVKAGWSENIDACKLANIGDNKYTLEISPSIRDFYGVPDGEEIEQIAFVFRNSDGSLEGKTSSGDDIFVSVSTNNLTVSFDSPNESAVFEIGGDINVEVSAANATGITLYLDEVEISTVSEESLSTTLTAGDAGEYVLSAEATDGTNTTCESITYYVRKEVEVLARPAGVKRGVNIIDDETVTFVLYAPEKEFVHVIGEFNDWAPKNDYLMYKEGNYFWLTLTGLDKDIEYAFQFFIEGDVVVADPYTNKTCDEYDVYIDESVYPDLKEYPGDYTSYPTSVFKLNVDAYEWTVSDFINPEIAELVIYELHIRDFTDAGDIKTVTDSIGYLKELGVTAIELMPFNEFEGNDSWGYNPSFYFAPDKAYGTANDYKEFIDVCHQNDIAVIMDMVLNHSYGQSPFARMYLDEDGNPAENNPWYNTEHNMEETAAQWGYDFDHESEDTQELVDSICNFWLTEYKLDGFRFDFTKGFTNTSYPEGDWASAYDASRIAILERMADAIWRVKSDAIISFEHLSDNDEEMELANYGILLWGNHNSNFNEATMGYTEDEKSDFSWASYQERGWNDAHIVNYMESHDEERMMYKNLEYGAAEGDYDVTELSTALERTASAAVFLLSIPGPKMIWQFGELGYDYSINTCTDGSVSDDCRTGKKPVAWEYYNDADRKELYDIYSTMIGLKITESVFATSDFELDVADATKRIELNYSDSDVRLVGNFDLVAQDIKPNFSSTGIWYNHFGGDSIQVDDVDMAYPVEAGEFILFSEKKLEGFVAYMGIGDPIYFEDASIAPNPTSNDVTLSSGDHLMKEVKITSITGVVMYDEQVRASEVVINVSAYSSGIYLVHLIGDDNGYRVMKLLKK